MPDFILAIDQGTTSTRSIVFDSRMLPVAAAQEEFQQLYPAPGLVEHDPEAIWLTTLATMRAALERAGIRAREFAALGITNQRETTVIWDRATGRPIHHAIVWQDRRTADICARLRSEGHEPMVRARTGLLLDPYFSATKIAWILDHVEGARSAARAGRLAFGTVDSFLLWRLTGGKLHATDATNAARTLLMDIHRGEWDQELCDLFAVPASLLPEIHDCTSEFGVTEVLGAPIRIRAVAGDQQALTVGQACFVPGMMKSTYGTGCFALINTGSEPIASRNRLLTTIAYQLGGKRTYALEGAIFIAGAAVQWLRDGSENDRGCAGCECACGCGGSRRAGVSGAGFCRTWRAMVGCAGARRALRAHPQLGRARAGARGAGSSRLSDARSPRGDKGGLAERPRRHDFARRWRNGGKRL